jgi:hypothetical protein
MVLRHWQEITLASPSRELFAQKHPHIIGQKSKAEPTAPSLEISMDVGNNNLLPDA